MITSLDEVKYEGGYPIIETIQKIYDQIDVTETRSLMQNGPLEPFSEQTWKPDDIVEA